MPMNLTLSMPTFALLVATAACSAAQDGDASSGTADALTDVRSDCAVFIDRLQPIAGPRALSALTLYVKTTVDPTTIDHVGFMQQSYDSFCAYNGDECPHYSGWLEVRLDRFLDAADYFQTTIAISENGSPDRQYVGAFFVQTKDGRRIWANASESEGAHDGNFVFGRGLYQELDDVAGAQPESDPQRAVSTSTPNRRDFNPHQCR